jgi:hypothetical protein
VTAASEEASVVQIKSFKSTSRSNQKAALKARPFLVDAFLVDAY